MTSPNTSLHAAVVDFCARIGRDRLLVQGAGGNVSYKSNGALWIKASGTWLADAASQEIFVPVDLAHLQSAIARDEFEVSPISRDVDARLRPSIETLLHALLPHAVVAHLHEIDALVHLVQKDCERLLQERLGDACEWVLVDYHKPGAPLAAAVARQLKDRPDANVVFLRNHGVVIGAKAVEDVDALLSLLTTRLRTSTRETGRPHVAPSSHDVEAMKNQSYILLQDETLTELVHDHDLYARLDHSWALYPDHVVFLGPTAQTYESVADCLDRMPKHQDLGYPIFIRDVGIFVPEAFNRARHEQLRCYYDVLARLTPDALTTTLSRTDIASLLDWDAERYRIGHAK